jgi:hypothetical protein
MWPLLSGLDGYGRDGPEHSFHEGTLYSDAASNLVYVECQTSMGAGETVMGKTKFEQMCWNLAGVTIKNFHSDNGVYDASVFRDDGITKDHPKTSLGLVQSIKTRLLNVTFRPFAIGRAT